MASVLEEAAVKPFWAFAEDEDEVKEEGFGSDDDDDEFGDDADKEDLDGFEVEGDDVDEPATE